MKNRLRLHNFLLSNNYLLNCEPYRSVIIKDLNSNRKYHFDKLDSNYLISNFIKVIEKTY